MLSLIHTVDAATEAMSKYAGHELGLSDHMGGFDINGHNPVLANINTIAGQLGIVQPLRYHQVIHPDIQQRYPNLKLVYDTTMHFSIHHLRNYINTPTVNYKNFLCSFNGTEHLSRRFLLAAMYRFGFYNPEYSSKNIVFTKNKLDGDLQAAVGEDARFFIKFFIAPDSDEFFETINTFGQYNMASTVIDVRRRHQHYENVEMLEPQLTGSFLHVVSETMGTSYQPFVTEKFLYSVVTRGLYVAYAQPLWHQHVEQYFGFRPYTKLFDYRFDHIVHPVHRLLELMTMISKFSLLSVDEWHDFRQIEMDTIEYNYDHYYSGAYLEHIAKHSSF
jgi:hypothetical protein